MKSLYILSLLFILIISGCSSLNITKDDAQQSLMLSVRAISVFKSYDDVESIVLKNETIFTKEEYEKLGAISKELKEMYNYLNNLNFDAYSAEKILINVSNFENIYSSVRFKYLEARKIIYPKLNQLNITDKIFLLNFDGNVIAVDKNVAAIQDRIRKEREGEIDITVVLRDIAMIVGTLAQILAIV